MYKCETEPCDCLMLLTLQYTDDVCFVVFAFFNVAWATLYLEHWKRRSAVHAYRWGTLDKQDELLVEPRALFHVSTWHYFLLRWTSGSFVHINSEWTLFSWFALTVLARSITYVQVIMCSMSLLTLADSILVLIECYIMCLKYFVSLCLNINLYFVQNIYDILLDYFLGLSWLAGYLLKIGADFLQAIYVFNHFTVQNA